jgi:ATP-dependent exoDNAse (exonuclease V) beta subunit
LQNLDALSAFAGEYEEHCRAQRQAATIAGLTVWLTKLKKAGLDSQPGDPKSNAVHVLTHHGAKGLEWPVVITMDLNSELKNRLWGSNVISETQKVDLKNPLKNRFIRFWPFPFGSNKKGMPIVDRIENSKIGHLCKESAIQEDKRLLYVSLTRARDLLVIALPAKKPTGPWMDTLNAEWMLPSGDTMLLPDKTEIPTAYREFDASQSEKTSAVESYKPFWFGPRLESSDKLPAILHPSSMDSVSGSKIAGSQDVGKRLEIKGSPSMDQVGLALHTLIAAEIVNPLHQDTLMTAERLLKSHGIKENIASKDAVAYVQHFLSHVTTVFKPNRILAEYPMEHMTTKGQLVKGWIDTLIEKNGSWVIIDHKFTTKPESELEKEALKYSGQIRAYREGVEAATAKKVESNWIHFPLVGILCELKI